MIADTSALVGATAQQAGRPLVSVDRGAAPTYEALGVDVRSLAA